MAQQSPDTGLPASSLAAAKDPVNDHHQDRLARVDAPPSAATGAGAGGHRVAGYLLKQYRLGFLRLGRRRWKRRYCLLDSHRLLIALNEEQLLDLSSSKRQVQVLDLKLFEACKPLADSDDEDSSNEKKSARFALYTSDANGHRPAHTFEAAGRDEMKKWRISIQNAIKDARITRLGTRSSKKSKAIKGTTANQSGEPADNVRLDPIEDNCNLLPNITKDRPKRPGGRLPTRGRAKVNEMQQPIESPATTTAEPRPPPRSSLLLNGAASLTRLQQQQPPDCDKPSSPMPSASTEQQRHSAGTGSSNQAGGGKEKMMINATSAVQMRGSLSLSNLGSLQQAASSRPSMLHNGSNMSSDNNKHPPRPQMRTSIRSVDNKAAAGEPRSTTSSSSSQEGQPMISVDGDHSPALSSSSTTTANTVISAGRHGSFRQPNGQLMQTALACLTQELNQVYTRPNNRVSRLIHERRNSSAQEYSYRNGLLAGLNGCGGGEGKENGLNNSFGDLKSSFQNQLSQVAAELKDLKTDIGSLQELLSEQHRCDTVQEQLELSIRKVEACQKKFVEIVQEAEQARDEFRLLVAKCQTILESLQHQEGSLDLDHDGDGISPSAAPKNGSSENARLFSGETSMQIFV